MAGIYAPQMATLGASALSSGLSAPQNIDYSNLFQSISNITEPKKVTQSDLKSSDRKNLVYELEKIRSIEKPEEQQVRYRTLRRQAGAMFPSLGQEDIANQFAEYTGELPFAEKSAEELITQTVMKASQEDRELGSYMIINAAKSGGDPVLFMQLQKTAYLAVQERKEKTAALKEAYDQKKITDEALSESIISDAIKANTQYVNEFTNNMPSILKQRGYGDLQGDAMYQALIPDAEKLEQDARNTFRMSFAQAGRYPTKEQEDRAVAVFTEKVTLLKSMAQNENKILTAKDAEETLRMYDRVDPLQRPFLRNNPEGAIILYEMKGGTPVAQQALLNQINGQYGVNGPSVKGDPNAVINTGVEGPADSATVLQQKYPFYTLESAQSAKKLGEQERADIITLFRENLKNPSKVAMYSTPSVNLSMTNLGYSYLMIDDTLDPRGEFITKRAIDTMFGGDALVLAETLAKKSPENAPDMYNKMTNMSSVAADRLIAKAKANLDIINRTAMQEDLLNPFVFKVDNNGNITGSFNMENVSKNSFIKNSLAKNDVINPNQIDQATFWKVMEDYTSIFDKAPLISDQSYQELKDSVESLQTLSKFSLKLPNVGGKPNAHSTIVARLPDLFSGKTLSLEEMTPAQIRRQAREFEKPARVKAVEGTR